MYRDEPDLRRDFRSWRISAKWLILFSVLTLIGFSAVCGSIIFDMRRGEEELARRTVENLVSTIDADISRNIELYDLSLRNVATNIVAKEVLSASKPLQHMILFDKAATAKHFGAIQVFNADGNLILDSSNFEPKPENSRGEEYFEAHRNDPNKDLYISRPALYRGDYSLILSRRIAGKDGSFQGVVVGTIRFSYFHDLFGRLQLQPNDTITVFRKDGMVIMRMPFNLDIIGKDLSGAAGIQRSLAQSNGAESRRSAIDNILRLYIWRDSGHALLVVAGKTWDNILYLWRREVLRIGAIMTALIVLVFGATLFLAREITRRSYAEDQLEELATTDSLTQLRNRRKFDVMIEYEWRRSHRRGESLALLMIDADHFKAFNDMFGHQAGDEVLVRIAANIRAAAKRVGDCAARYGGEEFSLLLSNTSVESARDIAEGIRARVESLSVEKWATTVSIGIAAIVPHADSSPERLIEAADKALYEAKSRGRNQSCVASLPHLSLVA
jgi:diguanylate cyclase (GGDEF)-like protein